MRYQLLYFLLFCCIEAHGQKKYKELLQTLWKEDSCSTHSNRELIANFIIKEKVVKTPQQLVYLLGAPLHIHHRKNREVYYIYPLNGHKNYFYSCNILALKAFKFSNRKQLQRDDLYYFIGDTEEEHAYWNSEELPQESYEGQEGVPYPFKYMRSDW